MQIGKVRLVFKIIDEFLNNAFVGNPTKSSVNRVFTLASGMSQTVNGALVANQANHLNVKGNERKAVGTNVIPYFPAINTIFWKQEIQETHDSSVAEPIFLGIDTILIFGYSEYMNIYTSVIRNRGQLTIPDKIRESYDWISSNSVVNIISDGNDEIIIKPHGINAKREVDWDKLWGDIQR
ncbi:MAG: AbrB/MazE/SpoVT family DNA-binding domain-containing protein, partial [Candidatus Gracilibacteria bacterium]